MRAQPIQLSAGINNRGAALLGRTQAQVDGYLTGALLGADQLRLSFVAPTDPGLFQYYAGAFSVPLNADGTTFSINGSYLRTRPTFVPLKGDAAAAGVQLSHPAIRSNAPWECSSRLQNRKRLSLTLSCSVRNSPSVRLNLNKRCCDTSIRAARSLG